MERSSADWDPDLYLKFRNERAQPVLDLVSRIDLARPGSILDVGCGPGSSTAILAARWPNARITGIDNSEAMIRQSRAKYPDLDWRVADARTFSAPETFDLVFANAVIHWIPDHERLLARLFHMASANGFLAVQMPLSSEMKIAELIENAFRTASPGRTFDIGNYIHSHPVEFYVRVASSLSAHFNLWTTTYFHTMDSVGAICEMMRSTRMRPYLDQLQSDREKAAFERILTEAIDRTYDKLGGGKVVFPFKRLFLLIRRT